MGLLPGQEPEEYNELDEAKRHFEEAAWLLVEDLADLSERCSAPGQPVAPAVGDVP